MTHCTEPALSAPRYVVEIQLVPHGANDKRLFYQPHCSCVFFVTEDSFKLLKGTVIEGDCEVSLRSSSQQSPVIQGDPKKKRAPCI